MVCKVADNPPLRKLRADLGFASVCHSFRASCIHRLPTPEPQFNLGGPGAAIGYCQALFHSIGDPEQNTLAVTEVLHEIGAPWSKSHELFWGYREQVPVSEYVKRASKPLTGTGRVPILITGLHVSRDAKELENIIDSSTLVVPGETILLRIIVDDISSAKAAVRLMRNLIQKARKESSMPCWWPLVQGHLTAKDWGIVKDYAGSDWQYINIATTPWTTDEAFRFVKDQVTVAQIPLGLASGVHSDGTLHMVDGHIKLPGTPESNASYNLFNYFDEIKHAESAPTLIILGPAQPEWTLNDNKSRVRALLPLLESGCRTLWNGLGKSDYEEIWGYVA